MQRPHPEAVTLNDILSTEGLSHALISNLPGAAVFVVDRDLRYLLAEGEALAIAGFKPDDFVGRTIFESLPPELAANYEPMYRKALAGEPFEDEHHAHDHWYISRGTPLRAENGEIYAVLVVSYDISDRKRVEDERKQAEAALRESEARLQSIANLVPDLLWDSEPSGSTNWYNQRWMEYTGQTFEQAIGWGWTDAIHPDDREGSARRYREAVEQGMPLRQEHRIRRHDGAYRWFVVKASPLKDESGKVIRMYGAATDIHEQRVALEALRESEAKYRTLFNAMEEGFCSVEVVYDEGGQPIDHRILEANPAFERQTGLTHVQGKLASELMPGVEQFWNELYARVVATGESERLEQYSPAFDRWFDVEISRIEDESLRRVAVVFQDITERKQAEVALRESEAKLALELADARQLQFISSQLLQEENVDALYEQILEAAIALMRSDMGSMQMLHPDRNELQLLAWKGFDPASAAFWERVVDSESICGVALRTGERAIVPDVETCEWMAGSGDLDAYRRSGVRAVQTTPLICRKGRVVGMISTHWSEPHQPAERELGLLDVLARQAADLIEQRQAEAALRESEERLRLALAAGEMGTWQYRFATDEHILDPMMRQLLGLPTGTDVIPLEDFLHIVHADDRPQVQREIERCLHEGGEIDLEFRVVWQNGLVIWLKDRGKAIRGEDDRPLFLTGAATDITQRKQAEIALQESESKYRSLFQSMDEGYAVVEVLADDNGEWNDFLFLEVNPAFEQQTGMVDSAGRKATEILGTPNPAWAKIYGRVAETGEPVRFEANEATLDRVFDLYAFRLGEAGSRRVAVLFTDITDRKRAEETLHESEEQQAFLLKFSDALRAEPDADAVANRALRMLSEQMQIDRCYIGVYRLADDRGDFTHQVGNDRVPPLPDGVRLSHFPEALRVAFDRTLVINDVAEMESLIDTDRRNLSALGLRALVAATLRKGENKPLWSIVAVSARPRRWTRGEIALVEEVTERTWAAMERARAEASLRNSEAKYRSLFDSIDSGFCIFEMVYNEAGEAIDFRYIETNPAFERQSGRRPQSGQTMRELFPEAEDMWLKDYAEVARTGQAKRFIDYHAELDRWFDVFVFPSSNGENQLAALFSDVTEEKRSEAALRESEERLQKAISIETVGVLFFTLDGRITDANDTFLAMSGYSRDELRNLTDCQELTLPEFWDVTSAAAEELATLGTTAPYEKQYLRKDGSRWWGLSSPTRLKGSGRHAECVEFVIDISEAKRVEDERKQAEAQLSRAAQMDAFRVKLSDALRSLTDPVQIQAEACRLLGEQLGVDRAYYVEVHEPEGYARVNQHYSRGDSPSIVGDYPLAEYGWSMQIMRRGETIVVADTQSSNLVPDAERAAMAMIQMVGFVALPLIKGEVLVGALTLNEPTPREWTEAEVDLVRETAERIWADIQRAHAETALRESQLQRIREQAAREEERQRAESLAELDRAKTTFFSNVSHEFRTPLTLSLAPLQDALSDRAHPLDPVHRERLELVHRNSLRLLKLVNTLLDFSRIEAGRMEAVYEPMNLATYTTELASVFRSAIERAGLQLIVDCPPLPEPVFVDREMWEKIVLNLLSNAFKFTFEGEIRVSLHSTDSNQVILRIQDTGTGIAPEHLPHLFERFYQVRGNQARTHDGSGIGLALVHELVRLQGGTIEVSSTLGEGTCFTVSLLLGTDHLPSDRLHFEGDRSPIRTLASTAMGATAYVEEAERWATTQNNQEQTIGNTEEQTTQTADASLPMPASARVLVVDDNTDMREYLTRILSEHVQVEAVADGSTALAAVQARVPDLILSDVMMPGLDGFELLEALRADPRTREIPIILLSARAGEEAIVEGLEAGADDYLIKPFSAQELVSRVTAHLQMAQLRGEALQEARSTLRSRDEFISVVSHELNTPLVSILGWTRMLRSSPPNPTMLSKALDTIERNATLQGKLVQDLLDLSRISAGKLRLNPQPIELQPVVETAIATVTQSAAEKGVNLTWQETVTEPVVVMGDRDRLGQVICNLLTNAIKFTPESGSVTLELSIMNNDGSADASYAEIQVTDTGIGIAADFLPHVFERFRQAEGSHSAKGLGLGLAIARHIVELHKGTIHAQSAGEGQGATFIVRLPLLQKSDDFSEIQPGS